MTASADDQPVTPPVVERRGCTVYVDGAATLLLSAPVMTRPQDWTPQQAALLWSETELARRQRA